MTKTAISKSMRSLPVNPRMELLEERWHSIAADQSHIPVANDQKTLIDGCLAKGERHPGQGMNLPEFRWFLKDASLQLKNRPRHK